MPCTAATVGICAYLNESEVRWNFSTVASSISHWPAAQASATCWRFAPTAKGASCQITRPSNLAFGLGHRSRMPSSTPGAQRVIADVTDRMAMPASTCGRCHRRTPVFPDRDAAFGRALAVQALGKQLAAVHRQGRARTQLARAGGIRAFRRMHALARGLQRPGRQRASLMLRPAAMSSATAAAMPCQPAACQVSNGPCPQPKPQRMARSRSRALSATWSSCTAL